MNKKTIIYCRLSTNKQDIGMDVQINALKSYCKMKGWINIEVIKEVESGKNISNRDQLTGILNLIGDGAVGHFLVYKLDRLGRRLKDILEMIETFKTNNVNFVSLNENFDTSTPAGMAFLQITGVFAEFERNLISTRTKEALQEKKRNGVILGRPSIVSQDLKSKVVKLRKRKYQWKDICKELNISFRTAKKCIGKPAKKT